MLNSRIQCMFIQANSAPNFIAVVLRKASFFCLFFIGNERVSANYGTKVQISHIIYHIYPNRCFSPRPSEHDAVPGTLVRPENTNDPSGASKYSLLRLYSRPLFIFDDCLLQNTDISPISFVSIHV